MRLPNPVEYVSGIMRNPGRFRTKRGGWPHTFRDARGREYTEYWVYRAEDARREDEWVAVHGYGVTDRERRLDAIRRARLRLG